MLLTNMDDDDTHVFRCIDAVFTALPNICMLCCNLGSNKSRQLREHLLVGKLSFSDSHNATLQIRVKKLFGTYVHFHC